MRCDQIDKRSGGDDKGLKKSANGRETRKSE